MKGYSIEYKILGPDSFISNPGGYIYPTIGEYAYWDDSESMKAGFYITPSVVSRKFTAIKDNQTIGMRMSQNGDGYELRFQIFVNGKLIKDKETTHYLDLISM